MVHIAGEHACRHVSPQISPSQKNRGILQATLQGTVRAGQQSCGKVTTRTVEQGVDTDIISHRF